ncbi:MAG: hypothetical protein HUU60_05170 [Armatimonadetes bacterium]|nr:hypothetical protein [Armatimonadota bacterium]
MTHLTRFIGLTAALLTAASAIAQTTCYDPPSPPVIKAEVTVKKLTLTSDQDDGFDGNAELVLTVNVNAGDCGQTTKNYEKDDLNWDVTSVWNINDLIWSHLECTPRRSMSVGTALIEVDSDLSTNVMSGLAGAAAGLAVGAYGGLVGAIGGAAAGFVVGFVLSLNGNDDLGVGSASLPENGTVTVPSRGADGGADIEIEAKTTPQAGNECNPPPPPPPVETPSGRTQQSYNPLQEALPWVDSVAPEPGNPGQLEPHEIEGIQRSLRTAVLGMGALAAAAEIEQAQRMFGVNQAIARYNQARMMEQNGDSHGALQMYREAFFAAATANFNNVPGGLMRLPFHLVMSNTRMDTVVGRSPKFLMFAPGAIQNVQFMVHGLPPEMTLNVQPLGHNVYMLHLDASAALPGHYLMHVMANDGIRDAQAMVEIVVNEPPQRRVPGDVNGDGCVDDTDLAMLLQAFGNAGGPEDVNQDGVVDDTDLAIVLENFGTGC